MSIEQIEAAHTHRELGNIAEPVNHSRPEEDEQEVGSGEQ